MARLNHSPHGGQDMGREKWKMTERGRKGDKDGGKEVVRKGLSKEEVSSSNLPPSSLFISSRLPDHCKIPIM